MLSDSVDHPDLNIKLTSRLKDLLIPGKIMARASTKDLWYALQFLITVAADTSIFEPYDQLLYCLLTFRSIINDSVFDYQERDNAWYQRITDFFFKSWSSFAKKCKVF